MSFESLLQGNGFNQIRKAQMGGNKKKINTENNLQMVFYHI